MGNNFRSETYRNRDIGELNDFTLPKRMGNLLFEVNEDLCSITDLDNSLHMYDVIVLKFSFAQQHPIDGLIFSFHPQRVPKLDYVSEDGRISLPTFMELFVPGPDILDFVVKVLKLLHSLNQRKIRISKDQVDERFEVTNGLVGLERAVVLNLCSVITLRKSMDRAAKLLSIRSLMGLCSEHLTYTTHFSFARSRGYVTIEITAVLFDTRLVLTVPFGAAVRTVKEAVQQKTGIQAAYITLFLVSKKKKGSEAEADMPSTPQPQAQTLLVDDRPISYYNLRDGAEVGVQLCESTEKDDTEEPITVVVREKWNSDEYAMVRGDSVESVKLRVRGRPRTSFYDVCRLWMESRRITLFNKARLYHYGLRRMAVFNVTTTFNGINDRYNEDMS